MKAISSFMKRESLLSNLREDKQVIGCQKVVDLLMKGSGREREGVGQTGPQASARLFGARDSCHCNASLSGRADVLLYSFGTERSVLSISCPSPPPSTIHLHLRLIVCNHAPLQSFPPALLSSSPTVHTTSTPATSTLAVYISRQLHADL